MNGGPGEYWEIDLCPSKNQIESQDNTGQFRSFTVNLWGSNLTEFAFYLDLSSHLVLVAFWSLQMFPSFAWFQQPNSAITVKFTLWAAFDRFRAAKQLKNIWNLCIDFWPTPIAVVGHRGQLFWERKKSLEIDPSPQPAIELLIFENRKRSHLFSFLSTFDSNYRRC